MKPVFHLRKLWCLAGVLLLLLSCSTQRQAPESIATVRNQQLAGFPYHPLVYHLDLSILAYHLYGQSLVWPFDPYYEDVASKRGNRARLMQEVRAWAQTKGSAQVQSATGLDSYRGPGILGGFADNKDHDPIIYRYHRIYPWSSCITNANGTWTEYLPPSTITNAIRDVYVCFRKTGRPNNAIAIETLPTGRVNPPSEAKDILLAFEGGTGDKGIEGQPASQSLMGFVLVRYYNNHKDFDIHITFRGSRSGSGSRAILQAFSDDNAKGNPDWITDLGYNMIGPESGGGHITKVGEVSRGMATSIGSILPQVIACLQKARELTQNKIPRRIYVTGHSLGGALAQVFTSAILLGDRYGPNAKGTAMPDDLQLWPWLHLKLITFGAPRVGNATWAKKLTEEKLSSEFFSSVLNPFDKNALQTSDPTILPNLTNSNQPVGYRILIPTDPITTEKAVGGKHVGTTVYVEAPRPLDAVAPPNFKAHEPAAIRKLMTTTLDDPRIPGTTWKSHRMEVINPERISSKRGNQAEYYKLANAIERYYAHQNIYFDTTSFRTDFQLFLRLYNSSALQE